MSITLAKDLIIVPYLEIVAHKYYNEERTNKILKLVGIKIRIKKMLKTTTHWAE